MARPATRFPVRPTFVAFVCGGVVGACALAWVRPGGPGDRPPRASAIELALDRQIAEVRIENEPLAAAAAKLSAAAGVPVEVHPDVRPAENGSPPRRFSVMANREPLGNVLDALIPPGDEALAWQVDGGRVLIVPTGTNHRPPAVARVYEVADLVGLEPAPRPYVVPASVCFGGGRTAMTPDGREVLAEMIQGVVAPETWRGTGGMYGDIGFLGGRLVVVQDERTHADVARLLAQLRAPAVNLPPAGGARGGRYLYRWDAEVRRWASADPSASVEARLDDPAPALGFEEVRLAEVVRRLADAAKVPILLARSGAAAGNEPGSDELPDRLVTADVRGMTLAEALNVLAAAAGRADDLSWRVDGETIVLSAGASWPGPVVTRVYDVRGLPPPPPAAGSGSTGTTQKASPDHSLVGLLRAQVDPDSWAAGRSAVHALGDALVVTQTWANHTRVRRVLGALRGAAADDRAPRGGGFR